MLLSWRRKNLTFYIWLKIIYPLNLYLGQNQINLKKNSPLSPRGSYIWTNNQLTINNNTIYLFLVKLYLQKYLAKLIINIYLYLFAAIYLYVYLALFLLTCKIYIDFNKNYVIFITDYFSFLCLYSYNTIQKINK